jgi:hypothetical protein
MFNSSALCRQQEAHHLRIAAETDLQNARRVALAAARAWEVQALEAESREAGSKDALSNEDAAIALEFLLENEADAEKTDDRLDDDDTTRQSAVSSHVKNEEKPA